MFKQFAPAENLKVSSRPAKCPICRKTSTTTRTIYPNADEKLKCCICLLEFENLEAFECGHLVCKGCCVQGFGFEDPDAFSFSDGVLTVSANVREGQFKGIPEIREVIIKEGVTEIGNNAFCRCTGLVSVTLPAGLQTIGDEAFELCTGLTSVTFPAGLKTIGMEAFLRCTNLTSVTFPEELTTIERGAFFGCTGLTSLIFPEGLQTIGDHAFDGCSSLAEVTFGDALQKIGEYAFDVCSSLASVTLPASVQTIGDNAFPDTCIVHQPGEARYSQYVNN